ncbi:MAG: Uma2 family endonuclease [Clostridiales bacterium]|nr:Uma2 family endonuclease [Clostridiales bacterium]
MPLIKEQKYTIDDIYRLPDGQRAELIDGQLFDIAPPSTLHQRISARLSASIVQYIQTHGGPCESFSAPFAVFLNEDDKNYVEPDISVICNPDKITENGCLGAPDWIIEIVSPGSRRKDYMIKLFKYRSAGVREYWIVDPEKDRILIYNFESEDTGDYTFSDSVRAGIYSDFTFDFSQFHL